MKIYKKVEVNLISEEDFYKKLNKESLKLKDLPEHKQNSQFYNSEMGYEIIDNGFRYWVNKETFEKEFEKISDENIFR